MSPPRPRTKRRNTATVNAVQASVRRHPFLSWGTLAAFVTVAGAIGGGSLWVIAQFQSTSDAQAHAARDEQRSAWLAYGQSDLKSLLLRNRVNECRAKKSTSAFEDTVCKQYEEEFADALARARELYKAAGATGKER